MRTTYLKSCKFVSYSLVTFALALVCSASAQAAMYPMPEPGNDIVGNVTTVKVTPGDSITSLRQKHEVSYHELLEANPEVDFNHLQTGQTIIIPSQYILPQEREGIVINTPELRLYYFTPDKKYVYTYPVGLGRLNWRTHVTKTKVVRKQYKPTWHTPKSIQKYMREKHGKILPDVILPGPENPMGDYALYLPDKTLEYIHGTNDPGSVGTFLSSGCMRLMPDAIKTLFENAPVGTPVYVVHQPVKAGWYHRALYIEAHIPVRGYEKKNDLSSEESVAAIKRVTNNHPANFDWQLVEETTQGHTGIPTPIGEQQQSTSTSANTNTENSSANNE
jgi:L,D-transpeptidase ErfK/SrfK